MGVFLAEDKLTFEELSPTLQVLLSKTIDVDLFNSVKADVDRLKSQIGLNRISIVGNVGNIGDPQNDREFAVEMGSGLTYRYKDGWIPNGGVYG